MLVVLLLASLVTITGLASSSGALEAYGIVGWRPIESIIVLTMCFIIISIIYRLKSTQPNPSRRSIRRRRSWYPVLVISIALTLLPAVDAFGQTRIAIIALVKAKLHPAENVANLPAASKLNVDGKTVENHDFSNQDLALARAAAATFKDVSFSQANLEEADFRNAVFKSRVEMTGADLCGADMRGTDLRGATGLAQAGNLRFMIVDKFTKFPKDADPQLLNGIVYLDSGLGQLYQCREGGSKMLRPNGRRE